MITGKLYNRLKWIAQILLPAAGTLYFAFSGIWNFPEANKTVGIIMIVDLFLGVVLWVSQVVYVMQIGQGDLLIEEDSNGEVDMRLQLEHTPEELVNKKEVRFKIIKNFPKRLPG